MSTWLARLASCTMRQGTSAKLFAIENVKNLLSSKIPSRLRQAVAGLAEDQPPNRQLDLHIISQGCELQALPARPKRGGIVPCSLQLSTQTDTLALALANLLDANIGCEASRTITKSQAAGRDFWLTSSSLRLIIDELLQLQGFCAHDLNLERRV